nr:zinc finger protein [Hymenolepis microstoma]
MGIVVLVKICRHWGISLGNKKAHRTQTKSNYRRSAINSDKFVSTFVH